MRTIARFGIRFFRFNESESSLPDTDALAARRGRPRDAQWASRVEHLMSSKSAACRKDVRRGTLQRDSTHRDDGRAEPPECGPTLWCSAQSMKVPRLRQQAGIARMAMPGR